MTLHIGFQVRLVGASSAFRTHHLRIPRSCDGRRRYDRAVAVEQNLGAKPLVFNAATGAWVSPAMDVTLRRLGYDGVIGELDPPIRNGLRLQRSN